MRAFFIQLWTRYGSYVKIALVIYLVCFTVYWIVLPSPTDRGAFIDWCKKVWNTHETAEKILFLIYFITFPLLIALSKSTRDWLKKLLYRVRYKPYYPSLFLVFIISICLILVFLPDYLWVQKQTGEPNLETIKAKSEVWKAIVQSLGGIALFVGVILTYIRTLAVEKQADAAQKQAVTAQRQVAALEDGQITTRYTEAIKQLGNENLTIRLGGIFALERIALDSLKREPDITPRDWLTVVRVLVELIREKGKEAVDKRCNRSEEQFELFIFSEDTGGIACDKDVETAISVLGILNKENKNRYQIDLNNVWIFNADLKGIDFSFFNLKNASLRGCDFSGSILDEAVFSFADIRKAYFNEASLQGTNLHEADLRMSELKEANLHGADLTYVQLDNSFLERATLKGATLENVKIRDANLENADFDDTVLNQANFSRSNLKGASFRRAQLREAGFIKADLTEADFNQANMDGARLNKTNLTGAKLVSVHFLFIDQLLCAKNPQDAELPPGLKEQVYQHFNETSSSEAGHDESGDT